MDLFLKPKKLWNKAYYQEPYQSSFRFQWVATPEEDINNPYINVDERVQLIRILTYAKIDFRKHDKVFINGIQYIIDGVMPKDLPEILNSPFFKTKRIGKELTLRY